MLGKGTIALLAFLAALLALSYYIYDWSLDGTLYLVGQAIAVFAIFSVIAGIFSKVRKQRIRVDIAFALSAIFLLFGNREAIYYTYDFKRFQTEARTAGADNITRVIQESTTEFAAALRLVQKAGQEASAKAQAIPG